VDAGYQRTKYARGHVEAAHKSLMHLPCLSSTQGNTIELHHRFLEGVDVSNIPALSTTALWSRRIQRNMANQPVSFLSETDLLLHLIRHSAYQHTFNNGPLVFSDMTYLIKHGAIDWPLFWQLAQATESEKGCVLMLKMTQQFDENLLIHWPQNSVNVPEETILNASILTLVDIQQAKDSRHTKTLRAFLGRIFPTKNELASYYNVQENTFWIYFYYPLNFLRLVYKGVPVLLKGLVSKDMQNTATALQGVKAWLRR
jgi:hypothetical protein